MNGRTGSRACGPIGPVETVRSRHCTGARESAQFVTGRSQCVRKHGAEGRDSMTRKGIEWGARAPVRDVGAEPFHGAGVIAVALAVLALLCTTGPSRAETSSTSSTTGGTAHF